MRPHKPPRDPTREIVVKKKKKEKKNIISFMGEVITLQYYLKYSIALCISFKNKFAYL